MAATELTRMDFHVARFMNSDDVEEMDDKEVGQFCLLLFKAWLIAKDVTLPVETEKLTRYARCSGEVSPNVLKQFPIVETQWGQRRQNQPQLEVWEAARARSDAGKKGAANRWGAEWSGDPDAVVDATALPSQPKRTATGGLVLVPTSGQNKTGQIKAEQPNPEQSITEMREGGAGGQRASLPSWKTLAVRHKTLFGKQASKTHAQRYMEACEQYGENVVLECFDDWAGTAKDWVISASVGQPLFAFWKQLPDMADISIAASREAEVAAERKSSEAVVAQQEATREEELAAEATRITAEEDAFMLKFDAAWAELRKAHHLTFGLHISSSRRVKMEHANMCERYGAEVVLECFNGWAEGKKGTTMREPAYLFWRELPDLTGTVIAVREENRRVEAEKTAAAATAARQARAQAVSIERQTDAIVNLMGKGTPDDEGWGVVDFMKDDEEGPIVSTNNTQSDGAAGRSEEAPADRSGT